MKINEFSDSFLIYPGVLSIGANHLNTDMFLGELLREGAQMTMCIKFTFNNNNFTIKGLSCAAWRQAGEE